MSVCVHVCAPLDICVYVPMVSGVYLKILTCFMQCFNNGLKRNSRNITTLISDCVTVYSWLRYSQIWGVATWRARVSLHRLVSIKREKEGSKTLVNKMLTQSSSFFPLVLFSCDENALQVFFFSSALITGVLLMCHPSRSPWRYRCEPHFLLRAPCTATFRYNISLLLKLRVRHPLF